MPYKKTLYVKLGFLVLSGMNLTSCASSLKHTEELFMEPQKFVGQNVTACGKLMDGQIVLPEHQNSALLPKTGLTIWNRGNLRRNSFKAQCIKGKIIYVGCRTDPKIICIDDAVYDYAIDLNQNN